jgi:hypothetical protein
MKTVKLFVTLLVAIVCAGLSSCSEDEKSTEGEKISADEKSTEGEKIAENKLIGKWEITQMKGWELNDDGEKENFEEADSGLFLVFEQEGKGYRYEADEDYEGSHHDFTWKLEGNILTTEEEGSPVEFKIALINFTTLAIESSQIDEYSVIATYTKR